jgi:hypothetical protein
MASAAVPALVKSEFLLDGEVTPLLVWIGPGAVPELMKRLGNVLGEKEHSHSLARVTRVLGEMGPLAVDAVPALIQALKASTGMDSLLIKRALEQIDPGWQHMAR